ncbi:MAG: hypothetical protein QGD96_13615, partial [Anaerolineae bacterium]|nr:hypothetical protein [Anaerolineae bacterium]
DEYGGILDSYIDILSLSDCVLLQEKFEISYSNNQRETAGTALFKTTLGYMTATDEHMRELGCTVSVPAPTENPNLIQPGTHLVGTDIQPGLYTGLAGEGLFGSCYWERLKDLSGSLEALLANDNSVGKYYIEVREGDLALKTDCPLTYLPVLPAPTNPFPTNIMAGTYLVGIDIQPGTYQAQAGSDVLESCYWERQNNVAGDFNAIIANDNSIGQYYVQIQPGDFAFKTDCDMVRIGD